MKQVEFMELTRDQPTVIDVAINNQKPAEDGCAC